MLLNYSSENKLSGCQKAPLDAIDAAFKLHRNVLTGGALRFRRC